MLRLRCDWSRQWKLGTDLIGTQPGDPERSGLCVRRQGGPARRSDWPRPGIGILSGRSCHQPTERRLSAVSCAGWTRRPLPAPTAAGCMTRGRPEGHVRTEGLPRRYAVAAPARHRSTSARHNISAKSTRARSSTWRPSSRAQVSTSAGCMRTLTRRRPAAEASRSAHASAAACHASNVSGSPSGSSIRCCRYSRSRNQGTTSTTTKSPLGCGRHLARAAPSIQRAVGAMR